MAPAGNTVAALRAEIVQWKEQLNAERRASQQKLDHFLTKNVAVLSALKDEVISIRTTQSTQRNAREDRPAPAAQRKRQAVRSNSSSSGIETTAPLDKDDMLDHVFGCVGGGDHLYVAGVNRKWRGRYIQHCAQTTTCARDKKLVTRYRSAIMSMSRLQYAKLNGLCVADLSLTQGKDAVLI
jgi:hypothetical protein